LRSQRDYASFYATLGQQGNWWHYLSSTWLLSTNKSPQEIAEALQPHLDPNDSILVTEIGSGARYAGLLPEPAWKWIEEQNTATEEQRKAQALRALMKATKSGITNTNPASESPNPHSFLGLLSAARPRPDKK